MPQSCRLEIQTEEERLSYKQIIKVKNLTQIYCELRLFMR